MKFINKIISILIIIFICFIFVGCDKEFNPYRDVTLNEEQQIAYNNVEAYAEQCNNNESKFVVLSEIKSDIKNVRNNEKLQIEISIGKLKIDKLILKEKLDNDINKKKEENIKNKENYKSKRDSIKNIYSGTQASYNSEINSINQKIGQAYADYYKECSKVNNSNFGKGYKEERKKQLKSQLDKTLKEYENQKNQLEIQWKNKQNYDYYNKLYNEADSVLSNEIVKLENKLKNDIENIDLQIIELIKQR